MCHWEKLYYNNYRCLITTWIRLMNKFLIYIVSEGNTYSAFVMIEGNGGCCANLITF